MNDDEVTRLLEASLEELASRSPRRLIRRLRQVLRTTELEAASLPWAAEHPSIGSEMVLLEGRVVAVDLHHLDCEAARHAVYEVVDELDPGETVRFIHGRGVHSADGTSSIRCLVRKVGAKLAGLGWADVKESQGHLDLTLLTRSWSVA